MPRQLSVALVAASILATFIMVAVRPGAHARRVAPIVSAPHLMEMSLSRFERCALQGRLSESSLHAATVMITLEAGRPPRVDHSGVPVLPVPTLRCVANEVRAILRNASGPPPSDGAFAFAPFQGLDLPMDPAPAAARSLLAPDAVDALVAQLRALGDDSERVARLAELEVAQVALSGSAVRPVLSAFGQPEARVGGQLCRIVSARGALRTIQAGLPPRERTRLRGLTRGACGVEVLATVQTELTPTPVEPPPGPAPVDPRRPPQGPQQGQAECTQDSDCTLACPVPPSCCPATCGCSHAVPRSEAAAIAAACENPPRDRRCPAMGCARQEFHAVCRAGQCRADRGMGMF